MTDATDQQLESRLRNLGRIVAVGWALITAAFGMGVWVTTLEIRARTTEAQSLATRSELDSLILWRTQTQENRFTLKDATAQRMADNERFHSNEQRLQRLEDSMLTIKESLARIEAKIGTRP